MQNPESESPYSSSSTSTRLSSPSLKPRPFTHSYCTNFGPNFLFPAWSDVSHGRRGKSQGYQGSRRMRGQPHDHKTVATLPVDSVSPGVPRGFLALRRPSVPLSSHSHSPRSPLSPCECGFSVFPPKKKKTYFNLPKCVDANTSPRFIKSREKLWWFS